MRRKRTLAGAAALGLALAVSLAACGTEDAGDDDSGDGGQAAEEQGGFTPPDIPMAEELGEDEGALSVLAWPGYAEDGSTDKAVDWVTPFEKETGCEVSVKLFGTSDEAVTLMKTGQYDVVSASGDAHPADDRGGRRGPGQHRPGAQLRRHLALPQGPPVEHGRTTCTTASRTATAPTC